MYLVDYHIHSLYSEDSCAEIEDIAIQAITRNIREIAITDSFEPSVFDNVYRDFDPRGQRLAIEDIQESFRDSLKIIQGVEIGQPHSFLDITSKFLENISFDLVIGTVNRDGEGRLFNAYDYGRVSGDVIARNYLEQLSEMVDCGLYDGIAMPDLPRYYAAKQEKSLSMVPYLYLWEPIFRKVIDNGKSIQVSTSGIRKSLKALMPEKELLKLYREMGGFRITVGSGARKSKNVGSDIRLAYQVLKEAGFDSITCYHQRIPRQVSLDATKDVNVRAV